MTAIEIPTPDPRTFDDATRAFAEAIADRYALKRMLGRGGMGVVYLARDLRLDRLVAIKTLPTELARDAAVRERFLRETRTAGAMNHPSIVPIFGADEVDGHVFFVMAYVGGESLAVRTRVHGPLEPAAVARYLRDVASALDHAHRRGTIHRDIKAENILIEREGDRALVTDFGIARLAEASPLTVTGQLLGTVHYVSPEQVSGTAIDARSDLYSLGVVGFLALTGRFPFDAEVASAVLVAHVTKPAPPVATVAPGVPAALAAIIDRCLQKDPAHRYASAAELAAALEGAHGALDRAAPPTTVSTTEAHAVWKRAAELQAATGIVPRPEIVVQERDEVKDRSRVDGVAVRVVRDAALEAGIDERYVEHALQERGLVPTARPPRRSVPAAPAAPDATAAAPSPVGTTETRRVRWIRLPTDVVHEVTVDGEVPARDVELLLSVLREESGRMGRTLAKTRELAWRSGWPGSRIEASIVPHEGRTTIRLERSVRRRTLGALLGTLAFGGFAWMLTTVFLIEGMGINDEAVAVMGGFVIAGAASVKLGGIALRRLLGRVEDRVRSLAGRLADRVRDRALPPPR
ncbi:MAG: serine/threonine protein kinase [Gemmatimonadales bacterium]|nr:serine/threonine protein kinase [Gemmatimonadales bacterium]